LVNSRRHGGGDADLSLMDRGDAGGGDADLSLMHRGDAAAATRIFL